MSTMTSYTVLYGFNTGPYNSDLTPLPNVLVSPLAGGAKIFPREVQIFEQCPIFINYVQHIFPGGGAKNFVGVLAPPGFRTDCSHLLFFPFPKKDLRKLMQ